MAQKHEPGTDEFISIMAAQSVAMTGAIQCLVVCLQDSGALNRGDYQEMLRLYIEAQKDRAPSDTIAILQDLRHALLD